VIAKYDESKLTNKYLACDKAPQKRGHAQQMVMGHENHD